MDKNGKRRSALLADLKQFTTTPTTRMVPGTTVLCAVFVLAPYDFCISAFLRRSKIQVAKCEVKMSRRTMTDSKTMLAEGHKNCGKQISWRQPPQYKPQQLIGTKPTRTSIMSMAKRKSRGGGGGGMAGSTKKNKRSSGATRIDFAVNDSDDDRYDDHLHSDDESSGQEMSDRYGGADSEEESDDDDAKETVDAKRVRLARQYLDKMERKVGGGMESDDDEDDSDASSSEDESSGEEDGAAMTMGPSPHDRLGAALARQRQKREGTLRRRLAIKTRRSIATMWEGSAAAGATVLDDPIASFRSFVDGGVVSLHRGHDLTATAVALHRPSGSTAYSGSKDNSIFMWDVERGTKTATLCPQFKKGKNKQTQEGNNSTKQSQAHRADGEVLALAASDDGRYLAAGHRDATIKIYDVRVAGKGSAGASVVATTFTGHKGPIASLSFRPGTLQLFTASDDRCIRHYNLEEMAYVETLYGHQAGVTAVSCPRRERPVSAGRDRTVRSWKLAEETHLIYRPGGRVSSADCVSAVSDGWFLSGHDDGHLSLWNVDKKRPVGTVESAHGHAAETSLPRGITSVDALAGSDVAVTGSSDGYARFWNVKTDDYDNDERGLEPLGRIPLHGFINDIALGPRARFCVATIGQEPRLGRWERVAKAKNRFAIVRMRKEDEDDGEEDDGDMDAIAEDEVAGVDGGEGSSSEEGSSSSEEDDDEASSGEDK